jgi:hypothetical protein
LKKLDACAEVLRLDWEWLDGRLLCEEVVWCRETSRVPEKERSCKEEDAKKKEMEEKKMKMKRKGKGTEGNGMRRIFPWARYHVNIESGR